MARIPFNRAVAAGRELEYVKQAVDSLHLSGDGTFTHKCHAFLEQYLGAPKVLLTTSCTHALEMTALLLGIEPGDEVIVPSFTFVSTANAFVLRGARPIFIDIRADTLNMDETQLEGLISARTKAIVVMHYAGVACEMDRILEIAGRHGIPVIEDNAHGLFGRYKGRPLGTFGDMATLSFHETKNVTCGEGGALVLNNPSRIERAEILREKGTERTRFFRGQIDRYTWVDVGSSYLPSDLLAAFLYGQLEASQHIQATRRGHWHRYLTGLRDWAASRGARLPVVTDGSDQPCHLFYLLMPSFEARQALIAHLNAHGISALFHYLPLNTSEMGRHLGGYKGGCPVTEDVSDRLVRLPLAAGFSTSDIDSVIEAVRAAR